MHHWHELVDGLRELNVYDNHKRTGIPERYRNGSEATRAGVLAGLLDSDGWMVNGGTAYGFAQCVTQEDIVYHARELAVGLGIKVGRTYHTRRRNDVSRTGVLDMRIIQLHGPNLAKLQPYIVFARKRVRPAWLDAEVRPIGVEQLESALMGRHIPRQGNEAVKLHLVDGYIAYTNAPAVETEWS